MKQEAWQKQLSDLNTTVLQLPKSTKAHCGLMEMPGLPRQMEPRDTSEVPPRPIASASADAASRRRRSSKTGAGSSNRFRTSSRAACGAQTPRRNALLAGNLARPS